MYKIVFVVAVFAFALQGAFSSPAVDSAVDPAVSNTGAKAADGPKPEALENKPADPVTEAPTGGSSTTPKPTSGATTSGVCILLVQISSLALVTKHMFF